MLLTCPICHVRYSLEAILQDEAARELLFLSGQAGRAWPSLVKYLGLFRSDTRPLAWDRALKLAKEVLEIPADPAALETALTETVEALRAKGGKALKNHNYLKRVLENVPVGAAPCGRPGANFTTGEMAAGQPHGVAPTSKTARAIGRLENWKRG
jgi:hypothetical protein